ncbi:MAG: peptidoglycan DD-metalloendopeptidase family protein [Anaerolineaceae bacterium]|nr:peptidoglycan DD-metalloendopeptidase family protein [Anaerolineaceae bacterium]
MIGRIIRSLVLAGLMLGLLSNPLAGSAQSTPPPPDELEAAIRSAVLNAFSEAPKDIAAALPAELLVDNIQYSEDMRWAVVWLAGFDSESGEVIATEPGAAIARNRFGKLLDSEAWGVTFPVEANWETLLEALPDEIGGSDLELRYLETSAITPKALTLPLRGYKLPWAAGLGKRVTNTIGHVYPVSGGLTSCPNACRYAYDFADGTMFPLLAAKGGIVKDLHDTCGNGSTTCTNYLVLEDQSTSPTTYQIYFHLAYNSIPNELQKGVLVRQGQYVGDVDDTGYSTGHHLHYHVTDNLYYYLSNGQSLPWGISVDIRFDDVAENDGTPRTKAEALEYPELGDEYREDNVYISGNVGTNPPTGQLNAPAEWSTFTDTTFTLSGVASDDRAISRVQILANIGAGWKDIGSADYANGAFSKTLSLCGTTIPRGPFGLAVRIWDREGNRAAEYTGLRQLFNNAACEGVPTAPVPVCTPASNQVALYSDVNYTGTCQKFSAGEYNNAQLGSVGDNNTASVQVGADVCAVLYEDALDMQNAYQFGRMETLKDSDANLADNRMGADMLSALAVHTCSGVDEPFLTFPGNLVDSDNDSRAGNPAGPSAVDSLVLAWTGGEGADGFTSSLRKDGVSYKSMTQQNTHTWSVGTLPAGSYQWTVTAVGAYSNDTVLSFNVSVASLPTTGSTSAPVNYDFEAGASNWTGSGLWGHVTLDKPYRGATGTWLFSNGMDYNDSTYRAGDLTSPPITLPSGSTYYLRFRSWSDVEGALAAGSTFATTLWDQRRVQISTDGGATFSDLYQMNSDVQNSIWLDSPAINLGAYAGKIVRIRFHFDSVDRLNNNKLGWAVDDVQINTTGPASCAFDNNNTAATAASIAIGQTITGSLICPAGDWDYYKFSGTGGQTIIVDVDAKILNLDPPSELDSLIEVIGTNQKDVLATNDDEVYGTVQDSKLEFILPATGTYYIRVRPWDYPGAGSMNHLYNLKLSAKVVSITRPTISISKPTSSGALPVVPFIVEAQAQDPLGSGVRQVDFYWHSADWVNGNWVKFVTDATISDGWWGIFTPSGDTTGSAFYYMATNNSGGTAGALMTGLKPDSDIPVSALQGLPGSVESTAVQLTWTASDAGGIERFDLQTRVGTSAWTNWSGNPIPGSARSTWFLAAPGTYQFRLRAVDFAGHEEAYPAEAEASVTLLGTCAADAYDAADGAFGSAVPLPLGTPQLHTLCQNDADWVSFNAQQGQPLLLMFRSLGGGAAVRVVIFDGAGQQVGGGSATALGSGLAMRFDPPASGNYRMMISALDAGLYGSAVQYSVWVGPGNWLHLPVINR